MNTVINCPINRGFQFTKVLTTSEDFVVGQMLVMGANLLGIVVERAEGATVRAATIAAGGMAQPPVATILIVCEDVTLDKLAGDDAIAAGVELWYDITSDCLVSSISNAVSGVTIGHDLYKCAISLEVSDDTADTIRVHFDGRYTVMIDATA